MKNKDYLLKFIISISIITVLCFVSLLNKKINIEDDTLIVWYVGQGQMVTYVTKTHCYHFDMGGEYFPKQKLFDVCSFKKNRVRFSHWDRDHINFAHKAYRILPSLCRIHDNLDLPKSKSKKRRIQSIPICEKITNPDIKELILPKEAKPKTSNERSRIYVLKEKILIPGDSTIQMEKYWAPLIKSSIQALIVGHHGSKSSTSHMLLNSLPYLHLAIVSAREKRYHHPHEKVVQKLKTRGVLLIRTEDFKHIQISLKNERLKAIPLY